VECAADVAAALGWSGPPAAEAPGATGTESVVSGNAILAQMVPGEAYDIDALAAATRLDAARLIPRLVGLELSGVVRRLDGGRFVRP
jgi:predicted Rossmann fold nucleotide-binding protein DprA/Smf involved in DNA uptake